MRSVAALVVAALSPLACARTSAPAPSASASPAVSAAPPLGSATVAALVPPSAPSPPTPAASSAAPSPPAAPRFPRIATDGTVVAATRTLHFGESDHTELHLQLRRVVDDQLLRDVLLSEDDPPKVRAHAEPLLTGRAWRDLVALELEEDPGAPERRGGAGAPFRNARARGAGLLVEFHEPELVVQLTGVGRTAHRATMKAWTKPGRKLCPTCDPCPGWLADLGGAWVDRETETLVVRIEYRGGSDVCSEPNEESHAVAMPVLRKRD